MAPDILKLASYVAIAEQALARAKAHGPKPGALIRATPGCGEACSQCPLECAVIASGVAVARRELAAAMQQAPTFSHGGRFYVTTEGRA